MFFRPDLESTLQPMNSSSRKRLSRRRREVSGHVVIRSVQRKGQRSGRVRTLTHATAGAAVDQRRRSLLLLTSVSTSNVNFDDAPIYGQPSAGPPLHQRSKRAGRWNGVTQLGSRIIRSEEHTSELQSPCNLVCRLLLEKKKKKTTNPT